MRAVLNGVVAGANGAAGLRQVVGFSKLGEDKGGGGVRSSRGFVWWSWELRGRVVAGDSDDNGGGD